MGKGCVYCDIFLSLILYHTPPPPFIHPSFLSPHAPISPIGPAMQIRLETSAFLLLCKSAHVFDIAGSWQWNYPMSQIIGNMWSLATFGLNFFLSPHLLTLESSNMHKLCFVVYFSTYFFSFCSKASLNKSLSLSLVIILVHTCLVLHVHFLSFKCCFFIET